MCPNGTRDSFGGAEGGAATGMLAEHHAGRTQQQAPEPVAWPDILDESVSTQAFLLGGNAVTVNYRVLRGEPGPENRYSVGLLSSDGLTSVVPGAHGIRVLLANREPLVLRGLESVLGGEPDMEVVGEASTGAEALALVEQLNPDIVVIDPNLADMGGLSMVEALHDAGLPARPVILAPQITDKDFIRARQLGVRGVVLTTMPTHLIAQCIRTVHAGNEFLEKDTLIKALTTLMRRGVATEPKGSGLTDREREVAELVAAGLSNTEIAHRLNCGAGTIKSHLRNIYDKRGLHSRYALMRFSESQQDQ